MNRYAKVILATVAGSLFFVAGLWAPISSIAQGIEPAKAALNPNPAPPVAAADAEVPSIKFDVVSFKLCKEGISRSNNRTIIPADGDFVGYHCKAVSAVIRLAYTGAEPFRMSGEPAWVDNDAYEFLAKVAPEDVATWRKMNLNTRRIMVRNLLADDLHLKVHTITEPRLMYALVAAPGGPKLKEYRDGESTTLPGGRVLVGNDTAWTSPYEAAFQNISMASLATGLSMRVGRDVIDKTGLTGHYNFTLAYPGRYYDPTAPDADDSHIPEIFDSLAKLGLKLESAKVESTKIVVDHIGRPSE